MPYQERGRQNEKDRDKTRNNERKRDKTRQTLKERDISLKSTTNGGRGRGITRTNDTKLARTTKRARTGKGVEERDKRESMEHTEK